MIHEVGQSFDDFCAQLQDLFAPTYESVASYLLERMANTDRELAAAEQEDFDVLQKAWELCPANASSRDEAYREKTAAWNADYTSMENALRSTFRKEKDAIRDRIAALEKTKEELSQKLPTLGFFKGGEKKRINQQIGVIEAQIGLCHSEDFALFKQEELELSDLQDERRCAYLINALELVKAYPRVLSPYQRKARLDYLQKLRSDHGSEYTQKNAFHRELLYYILELYGREINLGKDGNDLSVIFHIAAQMNWPEEDHAFVTRMRLSADLRNLTDAGIVNRRAEEKTAFFSLA